MNQLDALADAFYDDPGDAVTRLALADLLEETGASLAAQWTRQDHDPSGWYGLPFHLAGLFRFPSSGTYQGPSRRQLRRDASFWWQDYDAEAGVWSVLAILPISHSRHHSEVVFIVDPDGIPSWSGFAADLERRADLVLSDARVPVFRSLSDLLDSWTQLIDRTVWPLVNDRMIKDLNISWNEAEEDVRRQLHIQRKKP